MRVSLVFALVVSSATFISAQQGRNHNLSPASKQIESDSSCKCLESIIRLDVSSVERLILEPEVILSNPERFWAEDDAYRMVRVWHERNQQPLDMDSWLAKIESRRELSPIGRRQHPDLLAAQGLAGIDRQFAEAAVPHLCSFLPPEADLSTTIYFTTDMMPSGFQQNGNIVIHILCHELRNMFVHEVYHRGFSYIYKKHVTGERETDPLRLIYLMLQIEGMATYSAYMATEVFPQVGEVGKDDVATDYDLLDKPDVVSKVCQDLNQLIMGARSLESEELRVRSWQLGVKDRAYYVFGAHMARQIDEKLGRRALVETISQGPQYYVAAYNRIADPRLLIGQ